MRNEDGLYLPPLRIEGNYVVNAKEIIKGMKINHPNLSNVSLGSHVSVANDLKHGENFILKWEYCNGATSTVFVPFYENFTRNYGYRVVEEVEAVLDHEVACIQTVRRRCRDNSRVVFFDGMEAVIPTRFARKGGYIRRDHLRNRGDVFYYSNENCNNTIHHKSNT